MAHSKEVYNNYIQEDYEYLWQRERAYILAEEEHKYRYIKKKYLRKSKRTSKFAHHGKAVNNIWIRTIS